MKRHYPTPPRTPRKRRKSWVQSAANVAVAALKQFSNSATQTSTQTKKSTTVDGTTTQYDDKRIYKKRHMPRRKRRIWRKFVHKVNAVSLKDRGLQVQRFTIRGTTDCLARSQDITYFHLYGTANQASTGNEVGNRDMAELRRLTPVTQDHWANTALPAQKELSNTLGILTPEIRMQSAILDLTLRNTGTQPLILEVYHVWYSKKVPYYSMDFLYSVVYNNKLPLQAYSSPVTDLTKTDIRQLDTKLFDMPQLLSHAGIKVRSMREIQLPPGQIHKMQIRDPRNYSLNLGNFGVNQSDQASFCDPRITESYFVVAKNYTATDSSYEWFCDRTYRFTAEGTNTINDGTRVVS